MLKRHSLNVSIIINKCYHNVIVGKLLHYIYSSSLFKDTHREKAASNKTPALTKSTNMGIWVVGTSNQPFIKDFKTETKFSKRQRSYWQNSVLCDRLKKIVKKVKIVKLVKQISPNTKVVFSSLITRKDKKMI